MTRAVVDASVTLAWLFAESPHAQQIEARLAEMALSAPSLWRLEVVNAVLANERRSQITAAQGSRFLQLLEAMGIEVVPDPPGRPMEQLALLARPHQFSAYDAVYLELAIRCGAHLWTLDRNLQDAARRTGIPVIADGD